MLSDNPPSLAKDTISMLRVQAGSFNPILRIAWRRIYFERTIMESNNWIEKTIGSPAENPAEWVSNTYMFGETNIRLVQPRNPDLLLDDPAVHQAQTENDYMPYWAYLWPSSFFLADDLFARRFPRGGSALELGCGLGLAGIAALARGFQVTFSDYTQAALSIADHNARLNGFEGFDTRFLDWNRPDGRPYDIVLGADVLYENRCREDILRVLDALLTPGGLAILSDACRPSANTFADVARARGYEVKESPALSAHTKVKGRIFELVKESLKNEISSNN
jgi:predicted nicotinamide N-methyase